MFDRISGHPLSSAQTPRLGNTLFIPGIILVFILVFIGGAGTQGRAQTRQARQAPPAQSRQDQPPLHFLREAVWIPDPKAEQGSIRINGQPAPATPVPSGGWLISRSWQPRERMRVTWRQAGAGPPGALELGGDYRAPLRPRPHLWRSLELGGRSLFQFREPGAVTAMAFSRRGDLLAVGTGQGRVMVFRVREGEQLWQHHRPGRVIKHLAFAPEGNRLYVGEQGPEGRLAAYDLREQGGTPLWVRDTAEELGRGPTSSAPFGWVRQPGAYRLWAEGGDLLAAFTRSGRSGGSTEGGAGGNTMGRRTARARLYRVDGRSGNLRWAFPESGVAERVISWFALDQGAQTLALPLQLPEGAPQAQARQFPSQVVVLNPVSGRPAARFSIPAIPPYRLAGFWRGVALRPDGNRLAAASQDGRGFLFEKASTGWRLKRAWPVVASVSLGGLPVIAAHGSLLATAREVLFLTGPSYIPVPLQKGGQQNAEGAPPGHPLQNRILAHDWEGRRTWSLKLANDLNGAQMSGSQAAGAGPILAVLLGKEGAEERAAFNGAPFNGVVLLDLGKSGPGRGRVIYRYPLAGRTSYGGLALSTDGKWVALAEAPRRLSNGQQGAGRHRVLLLR